MSAKEKDIELPMTVSVFSETGYFLRNYLGDGEIDGVKFEVCHNADGALYVQFEDDKKQYLLGVKDFVSAIHKYKKSSNDANLQKTRNGMDA